MHQFMALTCDQQVCHVHALDAKTVWAVTGVQRSVCTGAYSMFKQREQNELLYSIGASMSIGL